MPPHFSRPFILRPLRPGFSLDLYAMSAWFRAGAANTYGLVSAFLWPGFRLVFRLADKLASRLAGRRRCRPRTINFFGGYGLVSAYECSRVFPATAWFPPTRILATAWFRPIFLYVFFPPLFLFRPGLPPGTRLNKKVSAYRRVYKPKRPGRGTSLYNGLLHCL